MASDRKIDKINKLQIRMSEQAIEELEDLQRQIDASTKTEVVRSSLKMFKYLEDAKGKGSKIIIRDKDGREREIIF